MKSIFYTLSAAAILASCSTSTNQAAIQTPGDSVSAAAVIEPLNGYEIAPRYFDVSAKTATHIDLPNGGSIDFPANAFVDGNGKPVEGTVKVSWKEYHSLTDIMISGIPMQYDSAGVTSNFVSGGMFTIDATQNGKNIELAKGKEATVALGSYDTKPSYNFYSLDDKTGKWDYMLTATGKPNKEAPVEKEAVGKKQEKPSADNFFDVQAEFSPADYPELAQMDILGWSSSEKLTPTTKTALAAISWKVKVTGKSGDSYNLLLTNGTKEIKLNATPVSMDDAKASTKSVQAATASKWESLLNFQQAAKTANLIRTASIPGFGSYNWDYVHYRQDAIALHVKLKMPDNRSLENASIFHVCPEERVQIKYSGADLDKFSFDPNASNCIVIIYPDKSMFTVNDSDFDAAKKAKGEKEFTFSTRQSKNRFNSPDDLSRMVTSSI